MVPNHFLFLFSQIFKKRPIFKIKRGRLPSFHHFNFYTFYCFNLGNLLLIKFYAFTVTFVYLFLKSYNKIKLICGNSSLISKIFTLTLVFILGILIVCNGSIGYSTI